MILNQFQSWVRTAPPSRRADGASALARAYLYANLNASQRADAARVLTGFLDDPSPDVRRSLAEGLASAAEAPHHIVLALADDCAAVSSLVLSRSPVLSDAELIDCAATAEPTAQAAIASRPDLSAPVAAALAEVGAPDALVVLAGNRALQLPGFAIRRMIERHGEFAELRQGLLGRDDLPPSVRVDLVAATARALAAFVTARNWLSGERMTRVVLEAGDKAAVTIAGGDSDSRRELVAHLRGSGRLTTGFAFRAILSGKIELFKAILVELSGMPALRVDGLVRHCDSTGFASLYRNCGLPAELLPAFRIALAAAREADWTQAHGASLSRAAIERVLTACAAINNGELDKLVVLLRRFEAEAAREEARIAPLLPVLRPAPLTLSDKETSNALLLTDLDAFDNGTAPARVQLVPRRGENVVVNVDLAAIEAELCAA